MSALALTATPWSIWAIAGTATAAVIARPFGLPEFLWAAAGALALVGLGLLPPAQAWAGVLRGMDVYLFLAGMMLLSELARQEGLFDYLAAHAVRRARGSAARLFTLIFAVGTVVTIFLSNDATAVVLTPAVAAAARAAKVAERLPYLLVCAFIANAASFVLPISNPANLVIYGSHMPPLLAWLPRYAGPSALAILATYAALRWSQRACLRGQVETALDLPALGATGRLTAFGIAGAALVLLGASGLGLQLGLPTFLAGLATFLLVLARRGRAALASLGQISWGVLPLVAGLFVLVTALERTGVTGALGQGLRHVARDGAGLAAWGAGLATGLACNLVNNLPAGLLAGGVLRPGGVPEPVRAAVLIGVDLGPNLSVTGSLATILWLTALRREGVRVSAWRFLKLGAFVMPPALLLAIGGALLAG